MPVTQFTRFVGTDSGRPVLAISTAPTVVRAADETPVELPRPGEWFGDFAIIGEIGRGGMGVVYRARPRGGGADVAIKTVRGVSNDPHVRLTDRLRREARAGRVRHPNVMPVLADGESGGRPYLVMPLAAGSLADRLRGERCRPEAALRLFTGAARGVAALHAAGLLHRDLKPSNILLSPDGSPRVADFGLIKTLVDESASLTHTGHPLGTPDYMPPEAVRGEWNAIGYAADVWSLGVVLYEMLTGRRPFAAPSASATLRKILEEAPVPANKLNPRVDASLQAVLDRCLEKDPARRYPSAKALVDDLERPADRRSATEARRPPPKSAAAAGLSLFAVAGMLLLPAAGGVPEHKGATAALAPPPARGLATPPIAAWIHQELRAGRAVTLLGDSGPPLYLSTAFGTPIHCSYRSDRPAQFVAGRPLLIALTPDRLPPYRISGEFQNPDGHMTHVGLFGALSRDQLGDPAGRPDLVTSCLALTYSDADGRPPNTGPHPVRLERYDGDLRSPGAFCGVGGLMPTFEPAISTDRPAPWRRITLEVGRRHVRAAFDGEDRRFDWPTDGLRLAAKVAAPLNGYSRPPRDLDPAGPAGLFLDNCHARVRNVVITPLPPEDD